MKPVTAAVGALGAAIGQRAEDKDAEQRSYRTGALANRGEDAGAVQERLTAWITARIEQQRHVPAPYIVPAAVQSRNFILSGSSEPIPGTWIRGAGFVQMHRLAQESGLPSLILRALKAFDQEEVQTREAVPA